MDKSLDIALRAAARYGSLKAVESGMSIVGKLFKFGLIGFFVLVSLGYALLVHL